MPQVTIYANKSAYLPYEYPNTNDHSSATFTPTDERDIVLIGFAAVPESVKFKIVDKIALYLHGVGAYVYKIYQHFSFRTLGDTFDENSVTYNNKPDISNWGVLIEASKSDAAQWYHGERDADTWGIRGCKNGICVQDVASIDTSHSNYKPYMVITYLDSNATASVGGLTPKSGYIPKTKDNVFSWGIYQSGLCFEDIKAVSTTFRWRAGTSGTIKTIACGTAQKVTVPAGTFTTNDIQWSVSVTLNTGATVTSDWITLSTAEAAPTAKPISPVGVVIDATIVNRFSWQHIISTGTPQSKADLQWSADGTTWNTLATVTGENQYYDVPANKFTSGTKYWRVRTYNTDGTPSEWSDKAEFIAINAPSAPSIVIQSTGPRPRITWQTSEQEAYQLTLSSGYASGTVYGTEKAWRSPVYLADGSYTVRVRVQNKYGMWSEWSAAALPVSHTEGEAITLSAGASHEAALTWQTAGSYDFYLIERDGVAIGRTIQKQYIDHTSINSVTYRVRGCYADSDNYGLSNTVTAEILPDTAMICDLESGTWQRLPLSETILRTNRISRAATISTVHLSGLAYPVAERTEFRDMAVQISCAFTAKNRAAALALEALVGRLVCAKTTQGDMATGYLKALEKNADAIMSRYSFEIQNIHREEAITLDP
nr:MAG TPA: Oligo alginate lyase [Caudoviricetes sp.]